MSDLVVFDAVRRAVTCRRFFGERSRSDRWMYTLLSTSTARAATFLKGEPANELLKTLKRIFITRRLLQTRVYPFPNILTEPPLMLTRYEPGHNEPIIIIHLGANIRHAVLGNAGTIISFRVGAEDAPYLAREFVGQFDEADLVQLPNYRIYLKLMIDGSPSRPFSGATLMPDPHPTFHV
jgi:hypothetical protein